MDPNKPAQSFATAQVHAGYKRDPTTRAVAPPIYASTAFAFDSAQHIEDIMSQKVKAFVYSRIANPTNSVFEERMAALEGGVGAVATSSGQAATMLAVLAIAKAGDSFILPYKLYGGTFQQFYSFFPRIGIKTTFIDSLDPLEFEKAIDETTKGIIIESISNPILELPDINGFSEVCKRNNIPLIVDNTFGAGGYLIKPIDHGADIVIESATKWINGSGTVLGGVVVDSGRFNWANGKFPEFTEPLPGYHGLVLTRDCGPMALVVKMRMETLREMGCSLSPLAAFQIMEGLNTLTLRMDKCTANALALAQFLDKHPAVAWVSHPSLPSHPSYELAKTMLPRGSGGMVSFGLKGDNPGPLGQAMIDATVLATHCANIGDVRTLVVCPAKTVQRQLSKEHLLQSGTPDDLIRVSCGIEDPDEIIADFAQAIEAVTDKSQ